MHQNMSMDMVNMVKDIWFLGWSVTIEHRRSDGWSVLRVSRAERRIGCDSGCHGGTPVYAVCPSPI